MMSIMLDCAIIELAQAKNEPVEDIFSRLEIRGQLEVAALPPSELDVAIEQMEDSQEFT